MLMVDIAAADVAIFRLLAFAPHRTPNSDHILRHGLIHAPYIGVRQIASPATYYSLNRPTSQGSNRKFAWPAGSNSSALYLNPSSVASAVNELEQVVSKHY